MKPSDHPEFFRLPPPEGRSRESSIVLDAEGRFFHDGELVSHPGMARAFASWIRHHPDDGRMILNNGYDWVYFRVEDVPFFVVSVHLPGVNAGVAEPQIELSDGSREPFRPECLRTGAGGALYLPVKSGEFQARFRQSAQLALAEALGEGPDGRLFLDFAGRRVWLPVSA